MYENLYSRFQIIEQEVKELMFDICSGKYKLQKKARVCVRYEKCSSVALGQLSSCVLLPQLPKLLGPLVLQNSQLCSKTDSSKKMLMCTFSKFKNYILKIGCANVAQQQSAYLARSWFQSPAPQNKKHFLKIKNKLSVGPHVRNPST